MKLVKTKYGYRLRIPLLVTKHGRARLFKNAIIKCGKVLKTILEEWKDLKYFNLYFIKPHQYIMCVDHSNSKSQYLHQRVLEFHTKEKKRMGIE